MKDPNKWLSRKERKIEKLRWRHLWRKWLVRTDQLRQIHRQREDEALLKRKRFSNKDMATEMLRVVKLKRDRAARVLHVETSSHMREVLDKLRGFEVFHGIASDKRSYGSYDYVVFGGVTTNPLKLLKVYYAPYLLDGTGRKKFLRPHTRMVAILDRRTLDCGYRLPTDEWMTLKNWLDKAGARSYDLHGHKRKMIVVIDKEI